MPPAQPDNPNRAPVRPFRRIAVTLDEWQGKAHWDEVAREFREKKLQQARGWARRLGGTVVISVYRRPYHELARIQGW
jgi:hypothetical protein